MGPEPSAVQIRNFRVTRPTVGPGMRPGVKADPEADIGNSSSGDTQVGSVPSDSESSATAEILLGRGRGWRRAQGVRVAGWAGSEGVWAVGRILMGHSREEWLGWGTREIQPRERAGEM